MDEDPGKNIENEKEEDTEYAMVHKRYEKYRNIGDIMKINEFQMIHKDFNYTLNAEDDVDASQFDRLLRSKFIYRSTAKTSPALELDVQYFRDIGLPSRNIEAYT